MFVTEVKAEFRGSQIAARNSWGPAISLKGFVTEARLYVDGEVVDTNSDAFSWSSNVPVLRGRLKKGNKVHVIEVFARAILRIKLKICIDGEKIAGDFD